MAWVWEISEFSSSIVWIYQDWKNHLMCWSYLQSICRQLLWSFHMCCFWPPECCCTWLILGNREIKILSSTENLSPLEPPLEISLQTTFQSTRAAFWHQQDNLFKKLSIKQKLNKTNTCRAWNAIHFQRKSYAVLHCHRTHSLKMNGLMVRNIIFNRIHIAVQWLITVAKMLSLTKRSATIFSIETQIQLN